MNCAPTASGPDSGRSPDRGQGSGGRSRLRSGWVFGGTAILENCIGGGEVRVRAILYGLIVAIEVEAITMAVAFLEDMA